MSNTAFAVNRPNAEQNEELVQLWRSCDGLTIWTGVNQFPSTIEEFNDLCDNEAGVTQGMLDEFIDDIRFHHRCRICADTSGVMETGRCESCQYDVDCAQ